MSVFLEEVLHFGDTNHAKNEAATAHGRNANQKWKSRGSEECNGRSYFRRRKFLKVMVFGYWTAEGETRAGK